MPAYSLCGFEVLNLNKSQCTKVHNCKHSPIHRYQNRLSLYTVWWRSRVHSLYHSKAWRTDKHIEIFLPRWRVNSEPTTLGMVIEDVRAIFVPPNHFRIQRRPITSERLEQIPPIFLKKSIEHVTAHKSCKFCWNRASIYAPNFRKIYRF